MGYLANTWCKAMHRSLMWPSHGHYQCRTCGREYPVPWDLDVTKAPWRQRDKKLVVAQTLSESSTITMSSFAAGRWSELVGKQSLPCRTAPACGKR
jgi:hypothetical protein